MRRGLASWREPLEKALVPSARPPCDASWAGEEGTGWVPGGVEGNRGRKADPKAGREAEAAAENRKREKTENLLSPLPRGFWDRKGGPLCMGEKTNSSNPPIKSLPPSGKRAG